MADATDMDLVREYSDHNSEPAFAGLVHRHINLVYSVALRYTGNSQDAQDVTQAVFIILARKSTGLRQRTTLTGWLYETTRFTARQLLRTRVRQQAREQEVYMQSTLNDSDTDNVWRQLAPLLEEAMTRLNEKERTLLALRFFENKSGAETAAVLGIQEWAAHKRAGRALEKLRKFFTKRGVGSTTAIIAGTISANSVQAAPVALAKTVTAVAIVKGSIATASTLTLVKGAMKMMTWLKIKSAVGIGAAMLMASGVVAFAFIDDNTSDPAANEILDKMQAKYASLSSYSDTGTSIYGITFVTKLARPGLYQIQWNSRASRTTWLENVIWSQGAVNFMFLRSPGTPVRENYYRMKDINSSLEISASQGAWVIPPLFFALKETSASGLLGQSRDFKIQAEEKIDGVGCFVLTGHLKAAADLPVTFWIGTNDFLIHQIRRTTLEPTGSEFQEIAKIQQALGDKPTDEQMREASKKIEEVRTKYAKNPPLEKVISIETHKNILINQQFKDADFTYSATGDLKPVEIPH
jgi:RNA polymerase sigma factor (sigma-70 family)